METSDLFKLLGTLPSEGTRLILYYLGEEKEYWFFSVLNGQLYFYPAGKTLIDDEKSGDDVGIRLPLINWFTQRMWEQRVGWFDTTPVWNEWDHWYRELTNFRRRIANLKAAKIKRSKEYRKKMAEIEAKRDPSSEYWGAHI